MRADALKALEQRKNSVMQEKHKKKMETLGVGNKYNNQPKVNISFFTNVYRISSHTRLDNYKLNKLNK